MSRVANVSFITHDDAAATSGWRRATRLPPTPGSRQVAGRRRTVHLEYCALGRAGGKSENLGEHLLEQIILMEQAKEGRKGRREDNCPPPWLLVLTALLGGAGSRQLMEIGQGSMTTTTYPPNNCFPLKQDWKLPTKCVRLETCVYVTVDFAIALGNIHKLRPILG